MTQILDTLDDNLKAEDVFTFKVYRSTKDGETVLGYLEPYGIVNGGAASVTFITTDFGVPVVDAYRKVVALAFENGIEAILIDDPDGLFPAKDRPRL